MSYSTLASYYDYIFPINQQHLAFINNFCNEGSKIKALEIGSATGNLTNLLNSNGYFCYGLDLDKGLLEVARNKYPHLMFLEDNMLNLDRNFGRGTFNLILSFGNTIVHLQTINDIKNLLKKIFNSLKDDGIFLAQIINYDRVVNERVDHLPTIDNDKVRFKRDYTLFESDRYVKFETELLVKESNQIINMSNNLITLKKDELLSLLSEVGFKEIQFYSSFKLDPYSIKSIPLILSCKK